MLGFVAIIFYLGLLDRLFFTSRQSWYYGKYNCGNNEYKPETQLVVLFGHFIVVPKIEVQCE
jgi:hypothetical protein